MRRILVAIALLSLCVPAAWAQSRQPPPGYGVVESVTRIPRASAEESASAGASRPVEAKTRTGYLVRVRMDDGSIQVRNVKRAEVKPGQRALVTNAGDVVPE